MGWRDLPTLHVHARPAFSKEERKQRDHAFNVTSVEVMSKEWQNRRLGILTDGGRLRYGYVRGQFTVF